MERMENIPPREEPGMAKRPLSMVAREVGTSFGDVVRSEIHLAKAEIREAGKHMSSHLMQIGLFSGIALLGVLAFVSFCIIGLGALLNDNYWLSSLIVSIVFLTVGGSFAYRAYRKMKTADVTFPQTRQTLNEEVETVEKKVREISEATKRRSA